MTGAQDILKVAVICDVLGQENNGTTIAAMNLIRTLREKGHTVHVVCSDAFRAGTPDFYIVPKMHFGPLDGYVEKNGVALAKADREILTAAISDVDVIHVMLPFALGKAAAEYAVQHRIPLTAGFHCQAENVTSHVFMRNFSLGNRVAYRVFYKRLYRHCDCIQYPTQFICDIFEGIVGPTPHRVISNGVSGAFVPREPENSGPAQPKYAVLFTGRYSPEKSHRVLIDAVALSRHREEIQLVFAGTGPLREKLRKQAQKRGIQMPVMQFYDRESLVDIINRADLYVHPAEIEIESIACLEAIACGRVPLIADSPRSATRYFALTEQNLFHFNDPADLAKKMDWWLEHPEERERSSAQYLGYARRFDFNRCMDEMEKMLLDAIEAKRYGA
mgnify:CR=1 FL=1